MYVLATFYVVVGALFGWRTEFYSRSNDVRGIIAGAIFGFPVMLFYVCDKAAKEFAKTL